MDRRRRPSDDRIAGIAALAAAPSASRRPARDPRRRRSEPAAPRPERTPRRSDGVHRPQRILGIGCGRLEGRGRRAPTACSRASPALATGVTGWRISLRTDLLARRGGTRSSVAAIRGARPTAVPGGWIEDGARGVPDAKRGRCGRAPSSKTGSPTSRGSLRARPTPTRRDPGPRGLGGLRIVTPFARRPGKGVTVRRDRQLRRVTTTTTAARREGRRTRRGGPCASSRRSAPSRRARSGPSCAYGRTARGSSGRRRRSDRPMNGAFRSGHAQRDRADVRLDENDAPSHVREMAARQFLAEHFGAPPPVDRRGLRCTGDHGRGGGRARADGFRKEGSAGAPSRGTPGSTVDGRDVRTRATWTRATSSTAGSLPPARTGEVREASEGCFDVLRDSGDWHEARRQWDGVDFVRMDAEFRDWAAKWK